jgi:saccharopine dehydrogenase (NAD+, L-lysine-forming)
MLVHCRPLGRLLYFGRIDVTLDGKEDGFALTSRIGIRREDMYDWERRAPLVPEDLKKASVTADREFLIQSSDRRIFSDDEYRAAGLAVVEDLSDCPMIIGLKEIPSDILERGKVYVFFSHVIKGQPANMPMLQRALDLECTIIDYERIVDASGRRLVFFGNFAGLAGMVDTLWTLGRRFAHEGIRTPLESIDQASTYANLAAAKASIVKAGKRIDAEGLPEEIRPLVIGIAGYGNVSKGAQEILDLLPVAEIHPSDLLRDSDCLRVSERAPIAKVVFREEDTVLRLDSSAPFDLREYYAHPERYRGAFERYLPALHVLVNCIYWESTYPRLIAKGAIRRLYAHGQPTLRVIGDISCDVEGGVETTVKATEPDDPVYVYLPAEDRAVSGVAGPGPVVMAVDILPSELPREASTYFSHTLKEFLPAIVAADYSRDFETLDLPGELKRAVIVHRGSLTPEYRYLEKHLAAA